MAATAKIASPEQSTQSGVRFGFTVGRRHARRAVDRVLVKRLLRESARLAAPVLLERARGRSVDVVMRLRNPLPDADKMALADVKRSLRKEADALLGRLVDFLGGAGP
jgi:ribonuclease P protein component